MFNNLLLPYASVITKVGVFEEWRDGVRENKPTVLFLANHYRGPDRAGGARTWHQVQRLGVQFHVILVVPCVDPLTQEFLTKEQLHPVPGEGSIRLVFCLRGSRRTLIGRLVYQVSSAVGMLLASIRADNPDVVIAMGAPPTSALLGLLASKLRGVPLLLDVRDIPLETAEELRVVQWRWLLKLGRWVEAAVCRRDQRIVCVSEEMAEFVTARKVPSSKVGVNYIGYDNFRDDSVQAAYTYRFTTLEKLHLQTEVIVVYAGTLATLVDVSTIMHAAQRLRTEPRVGFVIAGEGERRWEYVRWAEDDGLNMYLPGRLPKEEIHALCLASDVCVYPMRGGRASGAMLGNKIFDYLGAGKPVIYTGPDGAVPRLVRRLGAGWTFPQEDVEGVVSVLMQLVENPGCFAELGRLGRAGVMNSLTASHSADHLAQELEQLLER